MTGDRLSLAFVLIRVTGLFQLTWSKRRGLPWTSCQPIKGHAQTKKPSYSHKRVFIKPRVKFLMENGGGGRWSTWRKPHTGRNSDGISSCKKYTPTITVAFSVVYVSLPCACWNSSRVKLVQVTSVLVSIKPPTARHLLKRVKNGRMIHGRYLKGKSFAAFMIIRLLWNCFSGDRLKCDELRSNFRSLFAESVAR